MSITTEPSNKKITILARNNPPEFGCEKCGKPAMSVFSPISVCKSLGIRPDTVFHWGGKLIVPAGINILDGGDVDNEQDYVSLVLDSEELALNINTVSDLQKCKEMLSEKLHGKAVVQ